MSSLSLPVVCVCVCVCVTRDACELQQNPLLTVRLWTRASQVGLRDPPRPEVADAVKSCMSANVRVVVMTGDDLHTAHAICRQVGTNSK